MRTAAEVLRTRARPVFSFLVRPGAQLGPLVRGLQYLERAILREHELQRGGAGRSGKRIHFLCKTRLLVRCWARS